MFDWFFSLIGREPEPPQTTFCFCPFCHTELVSAPDVGYEIMNNGLVYYRCPCGTASYWDFTPPVPVLVFKVVMTDMTKSYDHDFLRS
jgi:hypothetical protein